MTLTDRSKSCRTLSVTGFVFKGHFEVSSEFLGISDMLVRLDKFLSITTINTIDITQMLKIKMY